MERYLNERLCSITDFTTLGSIAATIEKNHTVLIDWSLRFCSLHYSDASNIQMLAILS